MFSFRLNTVAEVSQLCDTLPFSLEIMAHVNVYLVWGCISATASVWSTVIK